MWWKCIKKNSKNFRESHLVSNFQMSTGDKTHTNNWLFLDRTAFQNYLFLPSVNTFFVNYWLCNVSYVKWLCDGVFFFQCSFSFLMTFRCDLKGGVQGHLRYLVYTANQVMQFEKELRQRLHAEIFEQRHKTF